MDSFKEQFLNSRNAWVHDTRAFKDAMSIVAADGRVLEQLSPEERIEVMRIAQKLKERYQSEGLPL